mmetsp:Transcript_26204/g.68823  ORF Transcript_26204/g.68823 Transcript_26204/m.68823 type:complete len:264 (-) Transcript_26204:558-1349(-)
MRPLTEEETQTLFEKLDKYIGDNVKLLVDRPDAPYCFRNHLDRVYYVREDLMKRATNFGRDNLLTLGTRLGKFSKKGKFRLHITALSYLAPYAKFKVWIKPNSEQSFLYGNHVPKAGLGRMTENTPRYQGVIVYNMNDVPLVRLTCCAVAAAASLGCGPVCMPHLTHTRPPTGCRDSGLRPSPQTSADRSIPPASSSSTRPTWASTFGTRTLSRSLLSRVVLCSYSLSLTVHLLGVWCHCTGPWPHLVASLSGRSLCCVRAPP